MPRTLTAKLIQLSLGTVERDASILSNATQRTLFLSPSKLLFLKGIETNLFELVAEIGRTPIISVTPSITPSFSIVFHGRTIRRAHVRPHRFIQQRRYTRSFSPLFCCWRTNDRRFTRRACSPSARGIIDRH